MNKKKAIKIRRKKASILIFTLWVLVFLAIFNIGLGYNVSSRLRFAGHFQDRLRMYYLAKSGIELGIAELEKDETPLCDSLNEPWSNSEETFKNIPLGDGYITLSYSLNPCALSLEEDEEQEILYGMMDELSKININKVPAQILKTLLENIGKVEEDKADDIAYAIVDWRDVDIMVSPGGAEDDYYSNSDPAYPCKNSDFEILEELLLVKGMTPEIFSKIKGAITIYGEGRVNINTAGWLSLHALGLGEELAERIIKFRQGNDGREGTEDDNVFKTVGELRNIGPLFTEESQEINRLTSLNILTVKSDVFRINSAGILKKGRQDLQRNIACVVNVADKKDPQILFWHEE